MKKLIILATTLLFTLSSHATLMKIDVDKTNYAVGDVVTANIIISNIEQEFGFQKLLATFDLGLGFDASALSYQSVTFGNKLDVDPFLPSDQFSDATSVVNELSLSEISYAFSNDLFFAQDGLSEFTLATVSFNVLTTGNSQLGFNQIALGDDFGGAFNQITSQPTTVMVNSTSVPEAPTFMLFALGMCLLLQRKLTK